MMNQYDNTYKTLENTTLEVISQCLNDAFSDYYVPIHMDTAQLQDFLIRNAVDLRYSYGAFHGDKMLGFLLLSYCDHAGEKTVFDAGTGVIPSERGKGVFSGLFQYSLGQLQEKGLRKFILEVMQQNERAIRLYERLGFSIRRSFLVLEAKDHPKQEEDFGVVEQEYDDFTPLQIENCTHVQPSFEYFTEILRQNSSHYSVAIKGRSYCVYHKAAGHICQIGYADIDDLEQIICHLLAKFDRVLMKNLDSSHEEVAAMLYKLGFRVYAKQYEMEQSI